jgi:hypothetical protein
MTRQRWSCQCEGVGDPVLNLPSLHIDDEVVAILPVVVLAQVMGEVDRHIGDHADALARKSLRDIAENAGQCWCRLPRNVKIAAVDGAVIQRAALRIRFLPPIISAERQRRHK